DPNPLVSGDGAKRLRDAGIEVESGVLESQARELNPGFIHRMEHGLPYVRCKLAMSLDGRTAMSSGESKWITGPAARADVQRLRARSDAIVTGIGTVLADNPSMNVRLEQPAGEPAQPLRVVLDPQLEMPPESRMLKLPGKTLVICSCDPSDRGEVLEKERAEVVRLPGSSDEIDLSLLLQYLAERQINEVSIEAGSTLAGAALWQGVVDELVVYAAPHIMGDGGRGLFHLPELELMKDRVELEISDVRMVGSDLRMTIKPKG
ncbi:MAG: bifunctional diaminohydroxyphosphoribosylaminopyrimidine deaminase/5-amino-6-(5-phosphoribosylamino)uracil reductase RibD, partial [Sedimenticola sp.]